MSVKEKNYNQITGLAGEFFVAAELFKRGFQVSLTLGNAKAVDLFALPHKSKIPIKIEVKTLRKKNCFRIKVGAIAKEMIYVFVILNDVDTSPLYFIVPGKIIRSKLKLFFGSSINKKVEGINYGPLRLYLNRWDLIK